MRVLGLDLSSNPGFAVVEADGQAELRLVTYKNYHIESTQPFPFTCIDIAESVANLVDEWVRSHSPDRIVIEETNLGKARYSQKKLEFIHFAVIKRLQQISADFVYIDTSEWRRVLQQRLSKEDRKNNAKVAKAKKAANPNAAKKAFGVSGKVTSKHLSVAWVNEHFGLKLKLKDNDVADAVCLCAAALQPGVRFCDGT
jgi:Holliday junction resolvasome RuvABC endonuclease subunit